MGINYSMCWEDPDIMLRALNINSQDTVISIASGGENTFAILLKNPKKIIAIDNNLEQIYLCKLKATAIERLNFKEFISLIGLGNEYNRLKLYYKLRVFLSKDEKTYWNKNLKKIEKGLLRCGRFEKYISIFNKYILPLIASKYKINRFLESTNIKEQSNFFNNTFNNKRFEILFKLFFSEKVMKIIGRDKKYFKYCINKNIAEHYLSKTRKSLLETSVKDNYFFEYLFANKINIPNKIHPYLTVKKFMKLKALIKKIKFIHQDVTGYLKSQDKNSITKANLSDIFEGMSEEEYERSIREIVRTCKNKGLICYWNNLVKRNKENIIEVRSLKSLSEKLIKKEKIFFYNDFIIQEINKKS
jgi:S-adenosylmethionine-diacylglycerol 3-amino-3-carboxypropyl transferase